MGKLQLEVLSHAEMEKIHAQTLQILEKVGFRVLDGECQALLERAGAKIDRASDTVYLPPELVEEALALAPSTYELHRIDGQAIEIGGDQHAYMSLVTDPWIIDYETEKPRRPLLNDVVRHTRLGDALPIVDILYRMDMFVDDVPGEMSYIRTLEALVTNTTKHLTALPASIGSIHDWLEIAEILAGDQPLSRRPILSFGVTATSPLMFTDINAEVLKACTGAGLPILSVDCPMAGTTSPLSFAGTLLVSNCECVFLIVMAQLMNPGTPITYGSGQSLTDLHSGFNIYYNADKMLWKVADKQMGRFYNVPVTGEWGGSMGGRYDFQSGVESTLLMLASAATGQHIRAGLGSCYNANGMSAEFMMIQAEVAELLERLCQGIDTSDNMLGYESIIAAGAGGHFLEDPLTIQMLRSGEFYTGGSFDRLGERSGNDPRHAILTRAHERVEALLGAHVPAVTDKTIEEIGRWARRKEGAIG